MNRNFVIKRVDNAFAKTAQEAIDNLNKPKGSLGQLERVALQVALVQHTTSPVLSHPCHLLFAADHGVEREGVSVSPRDVTWQQVLNFCRGGGGVNMLCEQHGFKLRVIDVGVDHDFSDLRTHREFSDNDIDKADESIDRKSEAGEFIDRKIAYGTRNFLHEAAMTAEEMERAICVGAEMTDRCAEEGCNVIGIGEMGIANTSPSSVWMYFFAQIPLDRCIGAGAGLNSEGQHHKYEVLSAAIRRFSQQAGIDSAVPLQAPEGWVFEAGRRERPYFPGYAEEIIRWFGGYEMVAAIGAMLRAAERGMLILVDGFIMSACMLAASQLYPEVLDYAIFCHEGDEAGHRMMLQAMGVTPLLSLGLRLGEGTGALCAYPLVDTAVRMFTKMDNFQHAKITKYF